MYSECSGGFILVDEGSNHTLSSFFFEGGGGGVSSIAQLRYHAIVGGPWWKRLASKTFLLRYTLRDLWVLYFQVV